MAEYTNTGTQTVNPGETVVFTTTAVPSRLGLVMHSDGTGEFLLRGGHIGRGGCQCCKPKTTDYLVAFGANIAIPTGGTVGAISLAVAIDGATIPASIMTVTPAAVEQYFNVSREINAAIFKGCCQSVTIRNVSEQPVLVNAANIVFLRPDLR